MNKINKNEVGIGDILNSDEADVVISIYIENFEIIDIYRKSDTNKIIKFIAEQVFGNKPGIVICNKSSYLQEEFISFYVYDMEFFNRNLEVFKLSISRVSKNRCIFIREESDLNQEITADCVRLAVEKEFANQDIQYWIEDDTTYTDDALLS